MMKYDTYIFDLDGTLLDTLHDLATCLNHALQAYGLPTRSEAEVRTFLGNGVRALVALAVDGGEEHPQFEELFATFKQYYMEHGMDTTRPYPGVVDMLRRLQVEGKHVAIVSNKFYAAAKELCQHFFGQFVSVAIGEREGIRKKPAPDSVEEAFRQLGVGKTNAVYVGDSEVDLQTAFNCNLPCISVLWGFRERDFLVERGATVFISHPSELP